MRHRITIVCLIVMVIITGFQMSLVSEAFINPSEKTRDWTVNQSAGIGTAYYVDRNHPQAQDGSDLSSKDGQKTFQVFLPFAGKSSLSDLPVFPGAEGFGTDTLGGRGGRVIRVTTLADDGEGSLRDALAKDEPRVIVFEVGGTIWLERDLVITHPFVTIAGQTAPPPGITLAGTTGFIIQTHDVLLQHLRVRVGDLPGWMHPQDRDGIMVLGSDDGSAEAYNVVIDHCSISWAIDENINLWYQNVYDVTIRHCIVSEGLYNSLHPKGQHSCGLLVGKYARRVSVIGNLFAHNSRRNPRVADGCSALVINNVIYNSKSASIQFQNLVEYQG